MIATASGQLGIVRFAVSALEFFVDDNKLFTHIRIYLIILIMGFKEIQIVKIGSQALFRKHDRVDINKINDLGHDVKRLRDERNIMSVLVTSGAVSLGRMAMGIKGLEDKIVEARVAASIGQLELMQLYKLSIGEDVAQILPVHDSILNERKGPEFAAMMRVLIDGGTFPVVNYNDPADDYEIRHMSHFADNDALTENLALMLEVDRVVILTNVDGLLDGHGQLIAEVRIDDDFEKLESYCNGKSDRGTGGMISKVKMGKKLIESGIEMVLGNSIYELGDIVDGKVPRTVFRA